jgi:tripartite-type tricarboxylate transporter receptor subunit TctC
MKKTMTRRIILAAAAASAFCVGPTLAQSAFPAQTIKIVVPYPAGGAPTSWRA